ncbi:hypothetical protein AB0I51_37405 [Streptomyces sp. NPDC050549]|uniref:hypothetical protein n=1 Tax=Streptomyces sp. NPDC050549 TaxID=3155406 RepID=UPI00343D3F0D
MADEEDSGSGSIRCPSWDHPVVATVVLELVGLAVSGLVALLGLSAAVERGPTLVG